MGNRIFRLLVALLLAMSLTLASAANNSSFSSNSFNSSKSSNSSNRAVSYLREESFHSQLLHRQKRWLVFELGTSLTLTGNCAKALLDPIPRGLIWLTEVTSIYPLPAGTEDWFPRRRLKPKPVPPPPPPTVPPPPPIVPPPPPPSLAVAVPNPVVPFSVTPLLGPHNPVIVPYSPDDPVHSFYYSYPQYSPFLGHRRSYVNQVHSGCPASKLVKDPYGNYHCRPTAVSRRLRRELERTGANLLNQGESSHGMLFDFLSMLSNIHQYKARYCIMRTLCEVRHLLAPTGESLFHDIFRIMLRNMHSEIAHKPTYHKAFTTGHSLHECAQRYGVHCPQSFLLSFTEHFHKIK